MTELKFYVVLLVNDSEGGMQICSYDTQASHGGKTQCYKCGGERGVCRKSYLVPICQYINTMRSYNNTVLFFITMVGCDWCILILAAPFICCLFKEV